MKTKTKIQTKLTAAITCLCFMAGALFPQSLYAVAANAGNGDAGQRSDVFSVPSSAGKVTSARYYGGNEIIINIQDLHCHSEVQKNIYKILGFLDNKYGLENVFLEGASGEVDTNLLSELAESEMGRSTVEMLLGSGYLNGTEYYAALNKKKMFVKGIEDESLYNRNIELLNNIMSVRPKVNEICDTLMSEMKPVKREYGSRAVRQLDRLVSNFEKKRIKAEKYYPKLITLAASLGLDTSNYPGVKAYAGFLENSYKINNEKAGYQFRVFFSELKNKIPYKEYAELSEKSADFVNIEDISAKLIEYAAKYPICEERKLFHLKNFFSYLEFNNNVNPVEFMQEERRLKEDLYVKMGRTKYEQDVLFLFDFIPAIQGYFTASITAEELETFKDNFARFSKVWCSYFPENTAKKLAPYAEMLSEYHNNNIKRDSVFAGFIINSRNDGKNPGVSGREALLGIGNALNGKNIKIVVTGGFHSKGLEKIFNDNKISYAVIMPKVTSNLEEAHDIYLNTIKSYASIAKNMINIKPFMAETVNESLPKLISSAFAVLQTQDIAGKFSGYEMRGGLREFVQQEFLNKHKSGNIGVSEWEIESFEAGKMLVSVTYKNNADGSQTFARYEFSGNKFEELTETKAAADKVSKPEIRPLSILNNLFKNTKTALYKLYTVAVAPILEEAVFRALPFVVAGALFSNPVSAAAIAFTGFFGIGLFTFLHDLADKSAVLNPYASKRSVKNIFFASSFITAAFLITAEIFPSMPLIAYGVSVLLHALNNALALSGKVNTSILSIFNIGKAADIKGVSANYDAVITGLEELVDKRYGESSDGWSLSKEMKSEFQSIINGMKSAKELDDVEKYRIVSEQVNNLFRQALRDEVKADNKYYSAFLADLGNALGRTGRDVKHLESGKTIEEKLSVAVNDALIEELADYLGGITYRNEEINNTVKDAAEKLSAIPKDMPAVEKASAVLGLFEGLFKIAGSSTRENMHRKLLPLSLYINNKQTNKPLFFDFFKIFDSEWEENERFKQLNPDSENNIRNRESNLRIIMLDYFTLLYPFSRGYALEFIKRLHQYGYIDNEEIPWSARIATKSYGGVKEYFFAIAKDGVDAGLAEGLQKSINNIKEINLSDAEAEKQISESITELEYLLDKINDTTMPLVEYQIRMLLTLAGALADNGNRRGLALFDAVRPAAESIIICRKNLKEKNKESLASQRDLLEKSTLKLLPSFSQKLSIADPEFDSFMEFMGYITAKADPDTDTNKEVRKILYAAAVNIYDKALKEGSGELKEKALRILRYIAETVPQSSEIAYEMFAYMGVNPDTLNMYISALRKTNIAELSFIFPKEDEKISYSEGIVDIILSAADIIDVSNVIKSAYGSDTENGRNTALELIDRFYALAKDSSADKNKRERAAVLLGRAAMIMHSDLEEKLGIAGINKLFLSLGMSSELAQPYLYMKSDEQKNTWRAIFGDSDSQDTHVSYFNYTELLRHLPKEIFSENKFVLKNPVFLDAKGITNRNNAEVNNMVVEFEKLQEVLKYNVLALESSKALSKGSALKDLDNILVYVKKMADALSEINGEHGSAALTAVRQISRKAAERGITQEFVEKQKILGVWKEDEIAQVDSINTLINAIHQTGINDFKRKIKALQEMRSDDVRTVTAIGNTSASNEIKIVGYDLSEGQELSRDMKDFFIKLAEGRVSINDLIFKEDLVVWTTRLYAHSVDMFFNFGDSDRGLSIFYHEAKRGTGNAARVEYFTAVLEKLGFKVDADTETGSDIPGTCGLRAVLNKDAGLNDATDLVDAASKAIMLFKHSTNLDMELDSILDKMSADYYFEPLVRKFLAGEIWYGYCYHSNGQTAFLDGMITKRAPTVQFSKVKNDFNKALAYLGLAQIEADFQGNLEQDVINKYLNREIERAYIEGRIVPDENGVFAPKEDYEIINPFVSSITNDNDELLLQSRTVNLAGKRKFGYRTLGFVGSYMFVSGVYKMPAGSIFVKGLMNPSTGRMKYAVTEYVTQQERRELTNDELLAILNESGLHLPREQELVSGRERDHLFKALMSGLQVIENPEIISTPMSDGNGTYVAGNLAFDRANVGEDDILIVPYTTPNDINAIKTAKAIITTGGGLLSHAAITTREFKKPSVIISNSALSKDSLDTGYYIQSGGIEEVNGVSVKKVAEMRQTLRKGARILLNGETGSILLFNDLDVKILDQLQAIISADNVAGLRKFIGKYSKDADLGRFIEYVYFQAIGDKKREGIMFALFDNNMPENVKKKIKELNEGYIRAKVQAMEEALNTLKSVDNVNIAYGILDKLISKLEFIKTTEDRDDIKRLKEKVEELQGGIKDGVHAYVSDTIKTARGYINKKQRSASDIRRMFKIQHQAAVYNYFISGNETRRDLIEKREELKETISEIDAIVRAYQSNHKVTGIESEMASFDGIYYEDVFRFGSKTAELATMYRLLKGKVKVAVPMGLGISTNFLELYFETVGKASEYKELSSAFEEAVNRQNADEAKAIAKKIQDLIDECRKFEENTAASNSRDELIGKIRELIKDGVSYSVRSSGVGEDGTSRAFAGMGETKLNVSYTDIFTNIEECWKSFYAERSIDYMVESGKIVKPAVLIQEMVSSEKSGVVFSRDKYGNTTIEAVYGLGEGLVSNLLTPDSVVVDAATSEIVEYSVAEKHSRIVPAESGSGTELQPVTEGIHKRILSASDIQYISSIINILEVDSGYPVDVEFAIDASGKLFILQRRAITTLENAASSGSGLSVYGEQKYSIALSAENAVDKNALVVSIAHPDKDEPVNVYYKKSKGNVILLTVEPEYSGILEREEFLGAFIDRVNTDAVVLKNLNSNLPVTSRVQAGEAGLIPLYIDIEDLPVDSIPHSTAEINGILSAA